MTMQRRIICQACMRVLDGYTDVNTGACRCELPVIRREDLEWMMKQIRCLHEVEDALRVARRPERPGW